MSDHADTIPVTAAEIRHATETMRMCAERIESLEADLQQAQADLVMLRRELGACHDLRQQAIDALREIASLTAEPPTSFGVKELSRAHNAARAALVKLGEQP